MNILASNSEYRFSDRTGAISVNGNNNQIQLKNCCMQIILLGNQNKIQLINSRVQIIINGNGNQIQASNSQITIGINGCGNCLENLQSTVQISHLNGTGNMIEQSSRGNSQQPYLIGMLQKIVNMSSSTQNRSQMDSQNDHLPQRSHQNYGAQSHQWLQNQTGPQSQQERLGFMGRGRQQRHPRQHYAENGTSNRFPPRNQSRNLRSHRHRGHQMAPRRNNDPDRNLHNTNHERNRNHWSGSHRPHSENRQNFRQNNVFQFQQTGQLFNFVESQESDHEEGLKKHQIDMLPTSTLQEKPFNCRICFEDVRIGQQVTYLFCFHPFHSSCCRNWLSKKSACPICQLDVHKQIKTAQSGMNG